MLGTFAVRAGELLAAVLAAGTVALAAAAAGVWWLKRRVRRLGRLGRVVAGRAGLVAAGAAGAWRRWLWSRPVPDRRWVAAVRERRRLWRAVGAAEHAVTVARRAGAPIGDLEGLCRRLRQEAGDADRALQACAAAGSPGGGHGPASARADDLVAAAGLIREAAASAAAVMARPAAGSLAEDVRREVTALSAGIASMAGAGGERG